MDSMNRTIALLCLCIIAPACGGGSQPTDGFEVTADLVYFMIISVSTPGELFRCTP